MAADFKYTFILKTSIWLMVIHCLYNPEVVSGQKSRVLANQAFDMMHYAEAVPLYEKYFAQTSDTSALENIAICYLKLHDYKKAEKYLGRCYHRIKSNPKLYLKYAEMLYINGNRDSSSVVVQNYIATYDSNVDAEKLNTSLSIYETMVASQDDYNITQTSFSNGESDYCPTYYNNKIVFTSQRKGQIDPWTGKSWSSIYITDESKEKAFEIEVEMSTGYHNGAVSFADPQTMYFTTNSQVKGKFDDLNLHIAVAERSKENKWVYSGLFPYYESEYSVAYPALSTDGTKMIFSSDKIGGKGGYDLYMSDIKDGKWGTPVHLTEISTSGDDVFPYLDRKGNLYFASDGYPGLGGLDIYVISMDEYKEKTPTHISAPINSSGDDFGLITKDDLISGYLSSNRKGENGADRIYLFKKK